MTQNFVAELRKRGMIYQISNEDCEINCVYAGFDATAKSLQIGNLFPLAFLRFAASRGVRVIGLLGGATSKIGDPTDKNEARPVLSNDKLNEFCTGIVSEMKALVPNMEFVNNIDWLSALTMMEFLDLVAHYVPVGALLRLKMFENRLKNHEPLSVKELLYPLMQGYDFLWLYENKNCVAQYGGSDQWCNILSGADLITKKHKDAKVTAITGDLLTNKDGTKMGKSIAGCVYVNQSMCSVYDFWQYWRNIDDSLVMKCLLRLTLLDVDLIEERMTNINEAKILLANELTTWVHGQSAAEEAAEKARKLFVDRDLTAAETIHCDSKKLVEVVAQLMKISNSQAKSLILQKAVRIENAVIDDIKYEFSTSALLQIGKHFKARVLF